MIHTAPSYYKRVMLVLMLAFFLGAYALEYLGIKYVTTGGAALFKIHAYSYLIMIFFTVFLFRFGLPNTIASMGSVGAIWCVAFTGITLAILYGLMRFGTSGMAYLVDTVVTPLILIPILLQLDQHHKQKILAFLGWLIFINALVALAEFAAQTRLIPVEYQEFSFAFFRSAGFLAHPLNNALITAALTPLLMGATRIPKIVYFATVLLALFAYGGRAAMAIFIVSSFILNFNLIREFISQGIAITKMQFAIYHALIFISFSALIAIVIFTPIGDRILSKLFIDTSAQARFDLFIILEHLTLKEWFFGASKELLANIDYFIGIKVIENYVVSWIIQYGVVVTVCLMVSVFMIPCYLCYKGDLAMRVSLFNLFFIALTNNALVAKTPVILFFNTALILYWRTRGWNK